MFNKKLKNEISYLEDKLYEVQKNTTIFDPDDRTVYPKRVPINLIIKELYDELYPEDYVSISGRRSSLKVELQKEYNRLYNKQELKISNLQKEVSKLKELVREVTDHVYKEDE